MRLFERGDGDGGCRGTEGYLRGARKRRDAGFHRKARPNTTVEVIEIDPVVVEAVNDHHGLTVPHRKAAMGAGRLAGGGSGDHREGQTSWGW